MKLYFLIFCFSFFQFWVVAQSNVGVDIDADLSVNNMRAYGIASFDTRDHSYTGSPLLWENWTYGKLKLKGNKGYTDKDYQMVYDAHRKLLFLKLGVAEYSVDLKMVDTVSLNSVIGFEQKFISIYNENGIHDLYEIILETDTLSLLSKKDVELSKKFYNTALDVGTVKPRISLIESLYLYRDSELFELPKKRKQFVDKYKDTKELEDVVSYFKEKKVNFKNAYEVQNALIELNKIK